MKRRGTLLIRIGELKVLLRRVFKLLFAIESCSIVRKPYNTAN